MTPSDFYQSAHTVWVSLLGTTFALVSAYAVTTQFNLQHHDESRIAHSTTLGTLSDHVYAEEISQTESEHSLHEK